MQTKAGIWQSKSQCSAGIWLGRSSKLQTLVTPLPFAYRNKAKIFQTVHGQMSKIVFFLLISSFIQDYWPHQSLWIFSCSMCNFTKSNNFYISFFSTWMLVQTIQVLLRQPHLWLASSCSQTSVMTSSLPRGTKQWSVNC